jgi:GNAT superfamily N-acetyltransferase
MADARIITARIIPLAEVAAGPAAASQIDSIFFGASGTQSFASEADRAVFRTRWLGRFLDDDAAHAFVACDADGAVIGYVVGALDDPARSGRFADIGYFKDFAHLTPVYPAHLHINLAPEARSLGIGGRLIDAFAAHAKAAGSPGMHVTTGGLSRNVRFYAAQGFVEAGRLDTGRYAGKPVVFLGRQL